MTALDDVSITFENGGFFALLGPSGSGKTTLLRTIAGFHFPESGSIRLDGNNVETVPVEKRDIGMMFQSYALFPNMTVSDNVGFGLASARSARRPSGKRIAEALELDAARRTGPTLSAPALRSQRQRVALARAIVTNPRVLLLDEPLGTRQDLARGHADQESLKRIQREVGITTIFVTHDQEEALTLSDRIRIMKEGQIVRVSPPREVYDRPVDAFSAGFLGEANWIPEACLGGLSLPAAPAGHPS
ncbi:MAG: ABC transporter ATP-binding protein [Geminicoccaceae bacterium]